MATMKRAITAWTLAMTVLFAAACTDSDAGPTTVAPPLRPVELGVLPDPPTPIAPAVTPPTVPPTTAFAEPEIEPIVGAVGEVVTGNRVLLIGDTAMATLTERQGGIACSVIPDFGWNVRIEAEVGRFIRFADEVVDTVVVDQGEPWDVVGLMFGMHVDTSADEFGAALDRLIDRLDGRPVLVYTIAERTGPDAEADEATVAVNEQIRAIAAERPNVVLVDFAESVNIDQGATFVDDDRVPTADGESRIVLLTLGALGEFPPGDPVEGACLDPVFTDDSAILL